MSICGKYYLKDLYIYQEDSSYQIYRDESICFYFKGYLTNKKELYEKYKISGIDDLTTLLLGYQRYKEQLFSMIDGNYQIVCFDQNSLWIVSDVIGTYPMYYARMNDGSIAFSSNMKELLILGVKPVFGKEEWLQFMTIAPGLEKTKTLLHSVNKVAEGSYLKIKGLDIKEVNYFHLTVEEYPFDLEETKKYIINEMNQFIDEFYQSDSTILLSGGIDSSIIASLAREKLSNLDVYSIIMQNGKNDFDKNNSFQPSLDSDYVGYMLDYLEARAQYIEIRQDAMVENLYPALCLRESVGMGDIDSSLYEAFACVSSNKRSIFTGECADEIFGGYPWFYKEELQSDSKFPWLNHLPEKLALFNKNLIDMPFYDYRKNIYLNACNLVEYSENDSNEMKVKRKMMSLSMNYFMPTLVVRMRMLADKFKTNVYLPFATKKLIQLAYNMPVEIYRYDNQEKGILRYTFKDMLPKQIVNRKKSPYPKTYSKVYDSLVNEKLVDVYHKNERLQYFINEKDLDKIISTSSNSMPFYGQLMCMPQFKAMLIQFGYWLEEYNVNIEI